MYRIYSYTNPQTHTHTHMHLKEGWWSGNKHIEEREPRLIDEKDRWWQGYSTKLYRYFQAGVGENISDIFIAKIGGDRDALQY